ncbi:MAG TPA: Calx-beta domain-containing protein, partial [Pyrinomonadaceae bacterium]
LVSVTTPAGWTRTDAVPNGGTGTLTFTNPTLAAGASSVFTVVVNVTAGTATGTTITNTATVSSTTTDPTPGNNSATATTLVQNQPNVSIQDASVVEPDKGSVNMIFTVTLSAPAPGPVSVNFATQDIVPASINTATAGDDYTATSGTVNFAAGEQFKTILVSIKSDKKGENNESFLVVLSNPVGVIIVDGTATGTIIENAQASPIVISELRTSGPAGTNDDFVEIHNNTAEDHIVNTADGGYGLFKMGATCSDTPVLLGVIPNGAVIPARGHFLFVGSAYSLADYGGTGEAAGDVTMSSDIENDRNVAIFSTTLVGNISSANRLDSVGFGPNVGGTCDLFREGTTLIPTVGSVLEYTYFRDECGKKGNPSTFGNCQTGGLTKDSEDNRDDFIFADTTAANLPAGRRLGAPGPQNMGSPHTNFDILTFLLDSTKGNAGSPNRERDDDVSFTNAAQGTMTIRRRIQNNTGAPVTRLRIRVVDISTTFVNGGTADLRVLSVGDITLNVNDPATCTAAGLSTPCNVTVRGTTLEQPPTQPLGGGFNSSLMINMGTPLAAGDSVNLQILLGVQKTGSFKFFFNVEALP